MNILVTGAAGFIGRALVQRLIQIPECDVFGLDNRDDPVSGKGLKHYFQQDITQPFHLDMHFDHVFHLAALNVTHVGKADYADYEAVNVRGTENLVKAVKTRKFVLLSTVKVYQKHTGLIDEESPVDLIGGYERSKFNAEEVCRQAFKPEDLVIFRSVNVIGPGQAEKAVIPVFFRKAINNEPLKILHPRNTLLQMLYIGDLMDAFCSLIEKEQAYGIINLCPDEIITLGGLAEVIVRLCYSQSSIDYLSSGGDVFEMKYVSRKAQELLDWKAKSSIKDILRKYFKKLR